MSERDQFESWAMSDVDLRITLENETYAGIAWMAWQASREALKADQVGDGWIACADRMPEVCANVIVTDGRETGFMWSCSDGRWDSWHSGDSVSGNVTHWQPLPSPPAINHPIDTTPNQYDALGKGER